MVYTRTSTCLNRSMTEKDFQRIQELLSTNLNAVEERINGRLDKVDERLDKIDGRLDSLEGRMNGVESRLDTLEHEMKEMRASMETRFDAIGAHFNEIDTRFAALDSPGSRCTQATHHPARTACGPGGDYREQAAGGVAAQAPRSLRWTPARRRLLLFRTAELAPSSAKRDTKGSPPHSGPGMGARKDALVIPGSRT